jgi:hypothetical protein
MPEALKQPLAAVLELRRSASKLGTLLQSPPAKQISPSDFDHLVEVVNCALVIASLLESANDHAWTPATQPPAVATTDPRFSIQVLGLIDDPGLRCGDTDEPFVDVVAWWPATRRWTVTHRCRADQDAEDFEVHVVGWRDLPGLPPRGTLWG